MEDMEDIVVMEMMSFEEWVINNQLVGDCCYAAYLYWFSEYNGKMMPVKLGLN